MKYSNTKQISRNIIISFFLGTISMNGQNPNNIIISSPPTNHAIDTYTRAQVSINLKPGFKYGFNSGGASNLLNLNISSLPGFVSNHYSSINNPNLFCQGTIDLNKIVGETEGNLSVSNTGGAVYTIPIYIPPGTNNVAPRVSVTYNSQSGNGELGYGWHLGAGSSIGRLGKIPVNDGIFSAVDLSLGDYFGLDGSRLILSSGSYGASNSIYKTEVESYSSITAYGQQGNGPQWFEVKNADGTIQEFGNTADSKVVGAGSSTILSWKINKSTDEFGNYILYKYKTFLGEVVIDKIEYTGNANAGQQPYNSVEFFYVPLAERNTFYINSIEFSKSALLKRIISRAEGMVARSYMFDYDWDNNKTVLKSITEAESQGNELNRSEFCWGDLNFYAGYQASHNCVLFSDTAEYKYLKNVVSADIDGDGFSDAVCLYDYVVPLQPKVKVLKNLLKQSYGVSNLVSFKKIYDNDQAYFDIQDNYNGPGKILNTAVVDENFDNVQEVYTIVKQRTNSNDYRIDKIISNGSSASISNYSLYTGLVNSYNPDFSPSQFYFDLADYTGDGLIDELLIDPENIYLRSSQGVSQLVIGNANTVARPFDLNGDGITEFITFEKSANSASVEINVYKLNVTSHPFTFSQIQQKKIFMASSLYINRNFLNHLAIGDYNGDGNADLVYMNSDLTNLKVMYSDGNLFLPEQNINSFTPIGGSLLAEYVVRASDLNQDGNADITISSNENHSSNPTPNYFTYYFIGYNMVIKGPNYSGNFISTSHDYIVCYQKPVWFQSLGLVTEIKQRQQLLGFKMQADYNGDGLYDILSINDPNTDNVISGNASGVSNLAINTIYTGMKKKTEIRYGNIQNEIFLGIGSNKAEVYRNSQEYFGPGLTPPIVYPAPLYKYKPSIYCVYYLTVSSGYNYQLLKKTKYFYENAILHTRGRGFLGFEKVYSYDPSTKIGSLSQNDFLNALQIPLSVKNFGCVFANVTSPVKLVPAMVANTNSILSQSENVYTILSLTNNWLIRLDQIRNTDFLNSTKSITDLSYDTYGSGQILSSTLTFKKWNGQILRTENNSYTYIQNNGHYKLSTSHTTKVQTGELPYSRSEQYHYDSQGHLLTRTNDPTFGNQSLITNFSQFTPFGLALVKTISAGDIASRSTQVQYDAKGRFITRETNEIGDVLEYVIEPIYGNPTQKTGITGLITALQYDGLGRLVKSILPNNAINKTTYAWDEPSNSYNHYKNGASRLGVYAILVECAQSPYTKTYYAGPYVLREETQGKTEPIIIDYKFNNYFNPNLPEGVLLEKSEAHFNSQTKYLVTKYFYEPNFYRKFREENHLLNGNAYTNTGLFSNITFNNLSQASIYNSRYESLSDQSGRITVKEYNEIGQLVNVKNFAGSLGQTANYSYLSNAQVKEIKVTHGANPQILTTAFTYDQFARQTSINDPSTGLCYYQYNTIGEVISQTKPGNNVWTFSYDLIGRIVNKTSSSGVTSYQYVNSNFGKNQIAQISGPNTSSEFKYDQFGGLLETKETIGNKVFKSEYVLDNYGRTIEHKFPSGVLVKYNYDALNNLIKIKDVNNNILWQMGSISAINEITDYSLGNGITVNKVLSDLHQLNEINYSNLCKQTYTYYNLNGSMASRIYERYFNPALGPLKEIFNIDPIDRLEKSEQLNPLNNQVIQTNALTYQTNGNITHKDDAGDYHYANPTNVYQLTSLTAQTNNVSLNTLSIAYNNIDKVNQIIESTSNKQLDFTYANDDQRIQMNYSNNGTLQYSRYYAENYDLEETGSNLREWTYIYAPTGLCVVFYNNNGNKQLLYAVTDHLGSPLALVNNNQTVVEEYSFDSWGRRRNTNNWSYSNITTSNILIRGFCMHEHLDEVALINMNGRMYDPVLGRFIQPDPYIQNPDNIQNFNRYSYCLNNPLKYTDPSGELIWVAPLIYAGANLLFDMVANNFEMTQQEILISIGTGAIAGFLGGIYLKTIGSVYTAALVGQLNRFLPSVPIYQSENFNLSVSPMVGFGTSGYNFGVGLNASGQIGSFVYAASVMAGLNAGVSSLDEQVGKTHFYNYGGSAGFDNGDVNFGIGYVYNSFDGKASQGLGAVSLQLGNVGIRFDEDWAIGDKEDRFRTGGLLLTAKITDDLTVAFGGSMMTGDGNDTYKGDGKGHPDKGYYLNSKETLPCLRAGIIYGGVVYKGESYFIGHNSENRLHKIQNSIHKMTDSPYFEDLKLSPRIYSRYGAYHKNYLYY